MTLDVRKIEGLVGPIPPLAPGDEAECMALGLSGPLAVHASIAASHAAYQAEWDGEPCAWWGWSFGAPLSSSVQAWLLTTPEAKDHPIHLTRETRRFLDHLLARYATIYVHVDPAYAVARKWLSRLGFVEVAQIGPVLQLHITRKEGLN